MSYSGHAGKTHWRLPLLLLLVALLLFAIITAAVLMGDSRLLAINKGVYASLQAHRNPELDVVMRAITAIGDAAVTVPVAMGALTWLLALRAWRSASYWVLATAFGTVLVGLVKNLTQVSRPQDLYTGLSNFSFPSGHSTMGLVVYGLLALFVSRGGSAGRRGWLLAAAAVLIGAIGFSRLYLGAHWFSDVVGGFALGSAWVAAVVLGWQQASETPRRLSGLLLVVLGMMLLAGAWHFYSGDDVARARYQQAETPAQ